MSDTGASEAKILSSAQDTLRLTEKVLGQVNDILGEPTDASPDSGVTPSVSAPLTEIQTRLDAARKTLYLISERLTAIRERIW